MMILLIYITNNELYYFTLWFYDFKGQILSEYIQVGILSPFLSLISYLLAIVIAIAFTVVIIGILGLRRTSHIRLLKLLPSYLLSQYISLYKVSIIESGNFSLKFGIISAIILIIVNISTYILYKNTFIKKCFI
ncbi:hypothetical protein [Saccharicrinis aurantiacus]|uniref:hypothetical protein n=1 Tax=Saccharicrinis aurantiacus TaxID=1849719 RepID=UPI00248F5031|nr:hypothetical protein [Saccharicrinis aurantiacus]